MKIKACHCKTDYVSIIDGKEICPICQTEYVEIIDAQKQMAVVFAEWLGYKGLVFSIETGEWHDGCNGRSTSEWYDIMLHNKGEQK